MPGLCPSNLIRSCRTVLCEVVELPAELCVRNCWPANEAHCPIVCVERSWDYTFVLLTLIEV